MGDFREIKSLLVDNEQMFVFNGIERMFDRHMFAKHSFDVKHLFEILTETTYTPVSVTPQEHSGVMTAILAYPANPPSVRPRVTVPPRVGPVRAHGPRAHGPHAHDPRAHDPHAHDRGVVQPAEVYRRRRLLVLAVVLSLLVGLWSFGRSAQSATTHETRSPDAIVVVVQPGDTLWAIASWLDPGSDPRSLVEALSGIAGSDTLQPGQRLVIPSHLLE